MIDQELAQRAILEALEGKIEAFERDHAQGATDTTLELFFVDDLLQKHKAIFGHATREDVVRALVALEQKTGGRFRIVSLNPSHTDRGNLIRIAGESEYQGGRIFPTDITDMHWRVKHQLKSIEKLIHNDSQTFWLSPREVSGVVAGKRMSFPVEKNGVQYRLLKWFAENDHFAHAKGLADEIESTTRTIQEKIRNLRIRAKGQFGLTGKEFIDSNNAEGYRRHPGIKLQLDSTTP